MLDASETNQKEEGKSMIAPSDSQNIMRQRSINDNNTLQS